MNGYAGIQPDNGFFEFADRRRASRIHCFTARVTRCRRIWFPSALSGVIRATCISVITSSHGFDSALRIGETLLEFIVDVCGRNSSVECGGILEYTPHLDVAPVRNDGDDGVDAFHGIAWMFAGAWVSSWQCIHPDSERYP